MGSKDLHRFKIWGDLVICVSRYGVVSDDLVLGVLEYVAKHPLHNLSHRWHNPAPLDYNSVYEGEAALPTSRTSSQEIEHQTYSHILRA